MAAVGTIMDALASQVQSVLCGTANPLIPELQVDGRLVPFPTPPAVDVYPADPFVESLGFGIGNKEFYFVVRARVSTAESEGGQDLLLSMMDPASETSMEQAIMADPSLGISGARVASVEGPTGFGLFALPNQVQMSLLGCSWNVRIIPT